MTDTLLHSQGCACCGDLLARRYDRRRFLHVAAGAGLMTAFAPLAFAAEGNYEAMLLTCIDPRFPEPTIKYMEGRHWSANTANSLLPAMAVDGSVDTFS